MHELGGGAKESLLLGVACKFIAEVAGIIKCIRNCGFNAVTVNSKDERKK